MRLVLGPVLVPAAPTPGLFCTVEGQGEDFMSSNQHRMAHRTGPKQCQKSSSSIMETAPFYTCFVVPVDGSSIDLLVLVWNWSEEVNQPASVQRTIILGMFSGCNQSHRPLTEAGKTCIDFVSLSKWQHSIDQKEPAAGVWTYMSELQGYAAKMI